MSSVAQPVRVSGQNTEGNFQLKHHTLVTGDQVDSHLSCGVNIMSSYTQGEIQQSYSCSDTYGGEKGLLFSLYGLCVDNVRARSRAMRTSSITKLKQSLQNASGTLIKQSHSFFFYWTFLLIFLQPQLFIHRSDKTLRASAELCVGPSHTIMRYVICQPVSRRPLGESCRTWI